MALVALAIAAHAPALDGGWIIDDAHYVADNRLLDDARGLWTIWSDPHRLLVYYPVTFTSFWIENQIWGRAPRGFHATNLVLHALTALLAWRVLRRLAIPGAWLAAAVFAVHPIHVDTVAWVAERKNVLSGALALASLLLYLEFDDRRESGRRGTSFYFASLALFGMALLAKTPIVGLPLVAALVVAWRRRRLEAHDVAFALPFLFLGAALSAITIWVERAVVAGGDLVPSPSLVERPFLVARATLFYFGKLAWPVGLSFDYGHWPTALAEPANLGAALALAGGIAALWAVRRRWGLGPLVAVFSFFVLAAPALGLVTFYFHRYSFVADHFVYLPSLPILALCVAAGAQLFGARAARWPGLFLAAAVLGALGVATWRHAGDYRDHERLGRAILRVNPASWLAHNHLGNEALRRRDFTSALEHLARAEQLAPDRMETQINVALARMNAGDLAGAEAAARRAIVIRDGAAIGHLLLGDVLLRADRAGDAVAAYRSARAREASRRASVGLGVALSRAGRHAEAVEELTAALGADPANLAARTALAFSLAATGRGGEAVVELERALALDPDNAVLRHNLDLLRASGPP